MDNTDYPGAQWFWAHICTAGYERALAELWALRNWQGPCDEFWRLTEIARIEHGLRGRIPDDLPEPREGLLDQVRASQARRLRAWLRQGERISRGTRRAMYPPEEDK